MTTSTAEHKVTDKRSSFYVDAPIGCVQINSVDIECVPAFHLE